MWGHLWDKNEVSSYLPQRTLNTSQIFKLIEHPTFTAICQMILEDCLFKLNSNDYRPIQKDWKSAHDEPLVDYQTKECYPKRFNQLVQLCIILNFNKWTLQIMKRGGLTGAKETKSPKLLSRHECYDGWPFIKICNKGIIAQH